MILCTTFRTTEGGVAIRYLQDIRWNTNTWLGLCC